MKGQKDSHNHDKGFSREAIVNGSFKTSRKKAIAYINKKRQTQSDEQESKNKGFSNTSSGSVTPIKESGRDVSNKDPAASKPKETRMDKIMKMIYANS